MEREKLIWILDTDNGIMGKSVMEIFLVFDIAFSAFIVCFGLLFKLISTSVFNISYLTFIISTAILFFVWFKFAEKVSSRIIFLALVVCSSTLKLLYGYWIFAKGEQIEYRYPVFTWVHMTVLVLGLLITIMFLMGYIKIYKDTNNMTYQELIGREKKTKKDAEGLVKSRPWIVAWIALLPSPYAVSKLLKIWGIGEGLGVGFGFWTMACMWTIFVSYYLPKLIIYIKHKHLL